MAKRVRFDYFKVYARSYNQETNVMEERLCDLSQMLVQAEQIETAQRVLNVGEDQARLQSITYNNNKWEMHFLRIRKDNFPLKTHDNGDFSFFNDLSEEEGFGEEVSALYDPENYTIMIRRNIQSLAPSAIGDYFTNLVGQPGFTVFFKPLVHPSALSLLRKDHLIRGAEVAIADVKNASQRTKRSIGQLINSADDIQESVNVVFKIGLEQKGSKKYSRIPIFEDLAAFANDENVKRAEVRYRVDEDAKVETVDLIENRLVDYSTFSDSDINPESRNILHATVINRMQQLYRTRIDDINNLYE